MKRWTIYATMILLSASAAISCGGGGSSGAVTPGPAPSFLASFTPANTTPGSNTVSLAQAPGSGGDLVTVNVGISGVNDVFAASFRLTYDTNLVTFGCHPGASGRSSLTGRRSQLPSGVQKFPSPHSL